MRPLHILQGAIKFVQLREHYLIFSTALHKCLTHHLQAPSTLTFCKRALPNGVCFCDVRHFLVTVFLEYFYGLFLTAITEVPISSPAKALD